MPQIFVKHIGGFCSKLYKFLESAQQMKLIGTSFKKILEETRLNPICQGGGQNLPTHTNIAGYSVFCLGNICNGVTHFSAKKEFEFFG